MPALCVFDLCSGIRLPSSSDDPGRCARLQAAEDLGAGVCFIFCSSALWDRQLASQPWRGQKLLHWGQLLNLSVPQFLYPQGGKRVLITYIVVRITWTWLYSNVSPTLWFRLSWRNSEDRRLGGLRIWAFLWTKWGPLQDACPKEKAKLSLEMCLVNL